MKRDAVQGNILSFRIVSGQVLATCLQFRNFFLYQVGNWIIRIAQSLQSETDVYKTNF